MYKTNSYTYEYKIIYDADGYITVYKYDSNKNEELIFDNCIEPDLSYGKLGFASQNTPGSLLAVSVKTKPVIIRKIKSDNEGTKVELLDNGYFPHFRVVFCEKNSGGLVKCNSTEQISGKNEIDFPPLSNGNYGEVFVFNNLNDMLPLTNKFSVIN